jgi:hypothetical protein
VLDVSSAPALWGGLLRGSDAPLMALCGSDAERAVDQDHAAELIRAELVQTLCAIGREKIDLLFLKKGPRLARDAFAGARRALVEARNDGHIGVLGLFANADESTRDDAFDALLADRIDQTPASESVVVRANRPLPGLTTLISVVSEAEVEAAIAQGAIA